MKTTFKALILILVASVSQQASCPRGPLYDIIEANVNRYANGIIHRTLYPNSHVMWKRLKDEYGEADAKIIMCETYSAFADIIRMTNKYWVVRLALPVGGGVREGPDYDYPTRLMEGEKARVKALELLAADTSFRDNLPGFDYKESGCFPEFDALFPSVS